MINMQPLCHGSGHTSNAEAVTRWKPLSKTAIGAALSEPLDIQALSHWKGSLWLDISAHRPILHTYHLRWVPFQRYLLCTIRIHM